MHTHVSASSIGQTDGNVLTCFTLIYNLSLHSRLPKNIRAVSTHAVTLRYSSGTATANVPALLTLESDGGELEQITFKVEEILSTETSTATKRCV